MPSVRIVTDSSAHFLNPGFVREHNITVLPLSIKLATQGSISELDLDPLQFITRLCSGERASGLIAPSREAFARTFETLAESSTQILSLHISARLSEAYENARAAARDVMGTVETTAIDARTTSVGLGYLVEKLALAADSGADLAELVRISHGIIPKIYGVFFIESMDYLEHSGRVGPAQAALGEMLGIKPVLTLEDGEIMPMEKVRTRGQGIEKLIEFAGEFTSLDRLTVLHSYPNGGAETRLLLDRLAAEFPSVNCPTVLFKPSLAAQIGPHGLGVVVCEGPEDEGEL